MVIFVIYISAFSSFISSAEGKRRSSTQAKRPEGAEVPFRACCFYELLPFTFALPFGQRFSIPLRAGDRWFRACGAKLAKLVSIRFHIRYFWDLPLSMSSCVKSFFMKKVSKYHLLAERRDKSLIYNKI